MTNVEALKALYVALGGTPSNVANASTIVEVLNAFAAKYDGDDDAILNPEAIANITAVAANIAPEPTLITKSITANGTYTASTDNADGYSAVTVNVPAPTLTGFPNTKLAINLGYAAIGYYNDNPAAIMCETLASPEDISMLTDFTLLGMIIDSQKPD